MNISKFIAKLVLVFFVFSSVQSPILADENQWKNMFLAGGCLAASAIGLYCLLFKSSKYDGTDLATIKKVKLATLSVFLGAGGVFGMYNFLKARGR